MQDDSVENANDASVPIRVIIVVPGKDHNITMSSWIKRILRTSQVICRIVYPQNLMSIDSVIDQHEG